MGAERACYSVALVKWCATQLASRLETTFCKPTLVHFQHVAHRFAGAMGIGRLWLHVCQVDDGAVVSNKGGSQGQQRVLHPEAQARWAFKDKQHALVVWHIFAEHQADAALVGRLCHLCVDAMHPGCELNAGQIHLGSLLREYGPGCCHTQCEEVVAERFHVVSVFEWVGEYDLNCAPCAEAYGQAFTTKIPWFQSGCCALSCGLRHHIVTVLNTESCFYVPAHQGA